MLEEYDWTAFSVVSTRHHGYQDFLSVVEGLTDGSFIGWEKKSVVILNVTDDPGGARTRRLLKENEAQVRQGGGRRNRGRKWEEVLRQSSSPCTTCPFRTGGFPAFSFLLRLSLCLFVSLSPLSSIPLFFSSYLPWHEGNNRTTKTTSQSDFPPDSPLRKFKSWKKKHLVYTGISQAGSLLSVLTCKRYK